MAKGCDSSWDFDYKSRVDALVDEGYTFRCRQDLCAKLFAGSG